MMGDEDKLPEVKLPFIGRVILRAMNSESPCQYRYGTIDATSFRIGADSRKRVKGALEWLSGRSGRRDMGTCRWERTDFAYPAVIPKTPLKLAPSWGPKADDTEARFENYAKDVVDCLKGLRLRLRISSFGFFLSVKWIIPAHKTKVVFHRNYSAQRLADAAKEWQQGCANIPAIRIKAWGEEKGETVVADPETPFPLQIAECLNRVWKLEGTSEYEVNSIPKSAGIELLLDEEAAFTEGAAFVGRGIAERQRAVSFMGNILHRNEVIKLNGFNKHKQLMPAIMGLLLWKLGIGKESYMNDPPYLVGRMLKLADDLHALYCKEVRKNNLPPQLLGNALMVAPLTAPLRLLRNWLCGLRHTWVGHGRIRPNLLGFHGTSLRSLDCRKQITG